MLKRITINNFRCLQSEIKIDFEEDLTVIVGENDAGKTSLVDALKVALQGQKVEPDDFSYGTDKIEIELEIDDNTYTITHTLKNGEIISELFLSISKAELEENKKKISSETFKESKSNFDELKRIANKLKVKYNYKIGFNKLKERTLSRINETEPIPVNESNIDIPIYVLDGKYFDNITSFVNELFIKEKMKKIWEETIDEKKTIASIVKDKIEDYKAETEKNINESDLIDKIKEFLPSFYKISITSDDLEFRDINLNLKVRLLENENDKEILVDKKGDGTKRRITMALLEYKNSVEKNASLYVFDEPDTHLHVKAQRDFINTILKFNKEKKQVIITTHSPFIINSCKPHQIRLLINENNVTILKDKIERDEQVDNLLTDIGVENLYLFFAKNILIVEGETEEKFIPIIFERLFKMNLYSNLIKVINIQGIRNVHGSAKTLLEFIGKDNIYVLIDNDADEKTNELIDKLDLDNGHLFKIGHKEFEDSFQAETIYRCWKEYVESENKNIGPCWSEENIKKLKKNCIANGEKFSSKLTSLNEKCGIKLSKPNLAVALGEYCNQDELDETLIELLNKLRG